MDRIDPHESLSAEELEILLERARALAKSEGKDVATTDVDTDIVYYLSFGLMDEIYGVPLKVVREVIQIRNIIHVPNTPAHLAGIVRIRGKVVALLDLRRYWHGADAGMADSDTAVIIEDGDFEFGIICSQINGLVAIAPSAIDQLPRNMPREQAACLEGIGKRTVLLLSLSKLLEQENFIVE